MGLSIETPESDILARSDDYLPLVPKVAIRRLERKFVQAITISNEVGPEKTVAEAETPYCVLENISHPFSA
jgi:hypothetical protein